MKCTNTQILNELLKLAKRNGATVIENKSIKCLGEYYYWRKEIRVWKLNNLTQSVLVLAHELGHHIDYTNDETRFINDSAQPWTICKLESIAWNNARKLLKDMGFKRWNSYRSLRVQCQRIYRKLANTNRFLYSEYV